jgi:hypothetical protein
MRPETIGKNRADHASERKALDRSEPEGSLAMQASVVIARSAATKRSRGDPGAAPRLWIASLRSR